jgi:hypothetical protein
MEAPIVLSDPNNMAGILITNLIKEEDIARQRSPLDSKIYAEMLRRLNVSRSPDSEQRTVFDVTTMVHYLGPRVSKYAQTTDKNVDYHVYPSGKQVIKSFIANDFQFINATGQVITELSDTSIEVVDRAHITWHIQKNRQNNQKITLLCDKTNPTICPILTALRLVLRARCLSQPDSMPVACYLKKTLWPTSPVPGSRSISVLRQKPCVRIYQKMTSNDIPLTRCESGLASSWTRRENCPITSTSVFDGWETPFECT